MKKWKTKLEKKMASVMTLVLGSRPKQRHRKVRVRNATQKSYLHSLECEGMNQHIPKWTIILGVGILMESWIFKEIFLGLKFIGSNSSLYHQKDPETRIYMTHLSTVSISYGQKKGRESKCQFYSHPLKVGNCFEIIVNSKILNKDYNFTLDFISIKGLNNKLRPSKVSRVPSRILGFPTWESRDKMTCGWNFCD